MKTDKELADIVQQLHTATEQSNETIGELALERIDLYRQIESLQNDRKKLQRRAIVAELTLKRLITSINPKLSQGKLQQEVDRIIGETEDDRSAVSEAIQEENLRNAVTKDSRSNEDETIDTLRWN